jgi:hypothetical protein
MKVTIKRDGHTVRTVSVDAATGPKDAIGQAMLDWRTVAEPEASYTFQAGEVTTTSYGDELEHSATALGVDSDAVLEDFAPAAGLPTGTRDAPAVWDEPDSDPLADMREEVRRMTQEPWLKPGEFIAPKVFPKVDPMKLSEDARLAGLIMLATATSYYCIDGQDFILVDSCRTSPARPDILTAVIRMPGRDLIRFQYTIDEIRKLCSFPTRPRPTSTRRRSRTSTSAPLGTSTSATSASRTSRTHSP